VTAIKLKLDLTKQYKNGRNMIHRIPANIDPSIANLKTIKTT